jgi:hypothetical protein
MGPHLLQQLLLLMCQPQLLCQRHNLCLALRQLSLVLLQRHLQLAGDLQMAKSGSNISTTHSVVATMQGTRFMQLLMIQACQLSLMLLQRHLQLAGNLQMSRTASTARRKFERDVLREDNIRMWQPSLVLLQRHLQLAGDLQTA